MDSPPAIEIAALARETLRDHRGAIVGVYELQGLTGKIIARDAHGVVVGSYDGRETRDARGRVIARGNLLGALLVQAR
jgi:hypothetical protein